MSFALPAFRALADPTRLRIVLLVRSMELSVGELAQVLGQSQPRVSRHLRILDDAGLLHRSKEGAWVFVRPGDAARVGPVLALLDAWGETAAADLSRLADVRAERANAAADYFAGHAAEWDDIRSLHVADSEVEAAIVAVLDDRPVGRLLDIGTGTGRMIELLGPMAASAIGLDRSPEMLRLARGKIEAAGLAAAEVRHADMYALPRPDGSADTVVLHQVLHYADAPGSAIAEAARVLSPAGRLLVVDFAPHDREELRARHAHTRLGFDDAQVGGWMSAAGLGVARTVHLAPGPSAEYPLTVSLWLGERQPADVRRAA
ncbi:MAG: ArsR/SmtB family transcription factor [Janthinobacterium lividum]